MAEVIRLSPQNAAAHLRDLTVQLQRAVQEGASLGFLPPVTDTEATFYWDQVNREVSAGTRLLLAAFEGEVAVGSVQVRLSMPANGRHRAEIEKLFVGAEFRGVGIGRQLLEAAEQAAREHQRTLIILDTRRGDAAERLYRAAGYQEGGVIPAYAQNANGTFSDTVIFYKSL